MGLGAVLGDIILAVILLVLALIAYSVYKLVAAGGSVLDCLSNPIGCITGNYDCTSDADCPGSMTCNTSTGECGGAGQCSPGSTIGCSGNRRCNAQGQCVDPGNGGTGNGGFGAECSSGGDCLSGICGPYGTCYQAGTANEGACTGNDECQSKFCAGCGGDASGSCSIGTIEGNYLCADPQDPCRPTGKCGKGLHRKGQFTYVLNGPGCVTACDSTLGWWRYCGNNAGASCT